MSENNNIADSYHLFVHSRKPFATSADVKIVLFALECLVDLVNAKGSVLSIWALDPPIFLLLGTIHILRNIFWGGQNVDVYLGTCNSNRARPFLKNGPNGNF